MLSDLIPNMIYFGYTFDSLHSYSGIPPELIIRVQVMVSVLCRRTVLGSSSSITPSEGNYKNLHLQLGILPELINF